MFGTRAVPEDFSSFVDTYGPRLDRACREIAGNEKVAEAMRLDLLAAVALRWRRRPGRWRVRSSLERLDHLLRREVRSYQLVPDLPRRRVSMATAGNDPPPAVPAVPAAPEDTDGAATAPAGPGLAAVAWQRAGRLRRQGRLGLAAAIVVLAGLAMIGPQAVTLPKLPPPGPTTTPDGVTVLPKFADLSQLQTGRSALPGRVALDAPTVAAMPLLAASPLTKAIAVAEPFRGRLIVIGPGGAARRVDDPIMINALLVATSLSPTGDLVALPRDGGLLVVDVRTGTIRTLPAGATQPDPPVLAWRDSHTVLLPGIGGARQVDVVTGHVSTVTGVSGTDVVTVEGNPAAPLTEMIGAAAVVNQRSLIRIWRSGPTTTAASSPPSSPSAGPPVDLDDRPVFGPAWIVAWLGPAWSSSLLFARACTPTSMQLPAEVGVARSAIGALQPNGIYAGTLVTVDAVDVEPLGFLRPQQLLVAARGQGATVLIGWTPTGGALSLVATLTAEVRLSVADLLIST